MRIRRTMAILLALCLTAPLTGCQLAREEQAASRDRLVGALVSFALFCIGVMCFAMMMTDGKVTELPYVGGFRLLP